MAILMPKDTRETLGLDAAKCESRSLRFDRFANPQAKEEERNRWFKGVAGLKPSLIKCEAWSAWLANSRLGLKPGEILFAQLQSRLMVNMAGGVMENAGLCLDRYGVPYIPGTAVKGCARRMAIQILLEAREAKEPGDRLARLLADIALVFGWGQQDWKMRDDSDFAYAVGDGLWNQVSSSARRLLPITGHFAGTVSFLPAYPQHLPANDIELDVVTCHHPNYYRADPAWPVALDSDDPNPVVFLTVAAGIVFQFAVLPIRRACTGLVGQVSDLTAPGVSDSVDTPIGPGNIGGGNESENTGSEPPGTGRPEVCPTGHRLVVAGREWLRQGLEMFGLGAKTAAGYGWFDASKDFNQRFVTEQREKAEETAKRLKAEQAVLEAKARERADKEEKERQRGRLTPDGPWMAQFKAFPEANRREIINKFAFEEEKWWPTQGELADERIQFSLGHFLINVEPEFLAADRASPKSKTAKALAALKRKFPALAPSSQTTA